MKFEIPLKEIMIAPGKRFDPSGFSELKVIESIKKIYGVIAEVMNISIEDHLVSVEFGDATPEKFNKAMANLKMGVTQAGKGQILKALKLFQETLAVIPENVDARRNMAKIRQESLYQPDINDGVRVNVAPLQRAGLLTADVLAGKDVEKAIADRAAWRDDEHRLCREGKLPKPGWWK